MYEDYVYIDLFDNEFNPPNKVLINDVLGNDYEKVLVVIDHNFHYSNQKLRSYNSKTNDYLYLKLLYQGLSRTREKLVLIVYKNKTLFSQIVNEGVKNETC